MLTNYTLSYHARVERANRITAILTYVGLGQPIFSGIDALHKNHVFHITNTGVIVVVDEKTKTIITMYLLTLEKLYALFRRQGYDHVGYNLDEVVKKNQIRYKWILKIKE